jgi:hypothetical protein
MSQKVHGRWEVEYSFHLTSPNLKRISFPSQLSPGNFVENRTQCPEYVRSFGFLFRYSGGKGQMLSVSSPGAEV